MAPRASDSADKLELLAARKQASSLREPGPVGELKRFIVWFREQSGEMTSDLTDRRNMKTWRELKWASSLSLSLYSAHWFGLCLQPCCFPSVEACQRLAEIKDLKPFLFSAWTSFGRTAPYTVRVGRAVRVKSSVQPAMRQFAWCLSLQGE